MKNSLRLIAVVVLCLGCSSVAQQDPTRPSVTLKQLSEVQPLLIHPDSGVPMEYRITITNPLDEPIHLVGIEIESMGVSGAYSMNRVRHRFDRTIAARSFDEVDIRAWVKILQQTDRGLVENPVLLRGVARFASHEGEIKAHFVSRVQ
jgi:hypothetical protein